MGRDFTCQEDMAILTLKAAGKTQSQISAATGRPLGSIGNRILLLKREGVSTAEERAAVVFFERKPFSAEEDEQIWALQAAGKTQMEIGRALGRSYASVRRRVAYLLIRQHPDAIAARQRAAALREEKEAKIRTAVRMKASLAGECRCLGGCGQVFKSPDRMRIRICPECKYRRRNYTLNDVDDYALRL